MSDFVLKHLFDLTPEELTQTVKELGLPTFRAKQILQWVYEKHVDNWDEMSNIGKADRQKLAQNIVIVRGTTVRHQVATDGVQKLLVDWSEASKGTLPVLDNSSNQTECVMIPSELRKTACISSQVGCPVGCTFCASGLDGVDQNLTSGQIVEQVWQLARLPQVQRISNVVFMGMGEPLANLNAVCKAIKFIHADWGMGISARKITVSTVGLPAQIRRLAEIEMPITLAISLHAPNDELRRELIPWADYVTISQLLEAGHYYFKKTGREITLEYILLGKINDQPEHAHQLARVARSLRSNVNLIRYNEVKGLPYKRPSTQDVLKLQEILRQAGVNVHIRASRGRDIAAACGQLRRENASSC
ncbi:MAG: 23S rRNA (adenine(2503)-C(2))-methyltransferase RlmN [Phycisphaeraceae bacterium]|nr:23S rRNA (adenine(2503)-C(2))-methyltransferase RlmN [Phycisphaeraceae bacterium]